ncbi:MAG: class II aldolase/adducin family protein [Candidatus Nanopelagicales bacterium]|nr:class II aldolase/adducin family protein [Candidatus Nanopelagicales bacterium]MCF8556014.1 class II aldolase/adducin family protein [Candidatus Nanopelagicales bacterium]
MSVEQALVDASVRLEAEGLNAGTSGNVSVRVDGGLLVTPSAVPPSRLTADALVRLAMDGSVVSPGVPTSEWRIHRDIYAVRPDAGAIVHTHSTYATALASLREDLPSFHYQVAKAGGPSIRCAPYATYGTQELSDNVATALMDRRACLMSNHGMLALGSDLDAALALAIEVEVLCRQFLIARAAGTPVLLSDEQMAQAADKFSRYGLPEA